MKKKTVLITVLGLMFVLQPLGAQTWTSAKRLTWNPFSSKYADITIDSSDNIHIAWQDNTPGNLEIFYKKSTNGGTAWVSSKRLTWNSGRSEYSAINSDSSDNIHIMWQDETPGNYEIYHKKSTNGGTAWSNAKRLTWSSGDSILPALAFDSGDFIHMVYADDTSGTRKIYYKKSTDQGNSWTSKKLTSNSIDFYLPRIAIDSKDDIYVVWYDLEFNDADLYLMKSTDGGETWSNSRRLTWSFGNSSNASINIDSSDYVHLAHTDDNPGYPEIYYRKSMDGGTTWCTKRLTWNPGYSSFAKIAFDSSDNIHIVWSDSTPHYLNYEIYYKKSTDGGSTWTGERLTWNVKSSDNPALAIDKSDNIHVIWDDSSPGNKEIFHKKGIQ